MAGSSCYNFIFTPNGPRAAAIGGGAGAEEFCFQDILDLVSLGLWGSY